LIRLTVLFFAVFSFSISLGIAQSHKYSRGKDWFSSTQGFIGFWAGANATQIQLNQSYSDFTLISSGDEVIDDQKAYDTFSSNIGNELGLSTAFSFSKLLTLAFSPSYKTIQYNYHSQFIWQDEENSSNILEHKYQHKQILHYLSLPLAIRFKAYGKRIRPYLQFGGYYDMLLNAQKQVTTEGIDQASGAQISFTDAPQSTDISQLYIRSHAGVMGGAGLSYNLGTMLIYLDAQYRYGLHSISSASNRYKGTRNLPGFGNVQDDLSIRNISLSFGCYFPLKFLTKDFKPVIL